MHEDQTTYFISLGERKANQEVIPVGLILLGLSWRRE